MLRADTASVLSQHPMPTPFNYNRIAGQNLERIAALSDGIFAVAMTLLVLDLHTPARELIHSSPDLIHNLIAMSPQFITYLMSFLTLGIFWMGQQSQLNYLARSNRALSWLNLAFLSAVSLLPFSTRLLAEFIQYRAAIFCYWLNILLIGAILFIMWRYVTRANLLNDDATYELRRAMERRILIGQALYAIGALLCFIDTRLSIAFIFLIQLNFAFAPRIPLLSRI
jgi:uncharacterized membrane protein